jgi:endonuclease-3
VCNRTRLAPGKTPLDVEMGLEKIVPKPFRRGAHHWLILHGRYICKARKPECWRCPVIDLCPYQPKTPPPASAKPARTAIPVR